MDYGGCGVVIAGDCGCLARFRYYPYLDKLLVGKGIVLGDPIISLQVVDAHILRVKHGIYLVETNQLRAIIVD